MVRRVAVRVRHQLDDPTARVLRKSSTYVTRRVEEDITKLAATQIYKDKFRLGQQQGPVEPKNVDVSLFLTRVL